MAKNYDKNPFAVDKINQYLKNIGSDINFDAKELNSLFNDLNCSGGGEF